MKQVRFVLRLLLNKPGFTSVVLLTIALGVGVNTAIFSVVYAVLLRPLPFPEPDRIVEIFRSLENGDLDIFSPGNFYELKLQSSSFESLAVFETRPVALTGVGEPERIPAARVTHEFFAVLKVSPLLGRSFRKEEDQAGRERVVLISYRFWQQRFGSDRNVIGRILRLDDLPYTVIGVTPDSLKFPVNPAVYIPLAPPPEVRGLHGAVFLEAIGRLKRDVSAEQAQAEINGIARLIAREFPDQNGNVGMKLIRLDRYLVSDVQTGLLVLSGAVFFVLLIACANLANLLLANSSSRLREFAVRAALGASQKQLLSQMILESSILSLTGGFFGVLLAIWTLPLVKNLSPDAIPRLNEATINLPVLFFALAVSLFTGIVFGTAPAISLAKTQLQDWLKDRSDSGAGLQRGRFGNLLIIGEVSLVVVLLAGAGLMIRSFERLSAVDPGFRYKDLLTLQFSLPDARYDAEKRNVFYKSLLESLDQIPGVEATGAATPAPFGLEAEVRDVLYHLEGQPAPLAGEGIVADLTRISTGYFHAMKIPLRRGRFFAGSDDANSVRVAIINETMARRHWPNGNTIGKAILIGRLQPVRLTIVGIVGDVKHNSLRQPVRPEIYIPYVQRPASDITLVLRTTEAPKKVYPAVKSALHALDNRIPLQSISSMESILRDSILPARFGMLLTTIFALLAFALALVGVYGLISYSVVQRTREMGIRMALGAERTDILRLVLRKGLVLSLIGIGLGLGLALSVLHFLSSLLYEVSAADPAVLAFVSLLLLCTALLAALVPAIRAARVDPLEILRYE